MATNQIPFTSPVGRYVQGDPVTASDKDGQGQVRIHKSGPKMGQPNPQYFMAVAFAKNDPLWPQFEQALKQFGAACWPSLFPEGAGGRQPGTFAWKITDGDGYDKHNKPNFDKPGFRGCWVVSFSSAFKPKLWLMSAPGQYIEIDGSQIKRGHYVQVSGNCSSNENASNPGMYMNLNQVLYVGGQPSDEIITGPTAQQAFGQGPTALPPGVQMASAPIASPGAPAAPTGYPPAPQPQAAPPAYGAAPSPVAQQPYPTPPTAPVASPMTPQTTYPSNPPPVQPVQQPYQQPPVQQNGYTGFMQPGAAPVPQPPVQTAAVHLMTVKANGIPYESWIAQGWTDAALVQNGYMDGVPV